MNFDRPVPPRNYDLPNDQYGEFWLMAQGETDYVVPAFPIYVPGYGTMLTIGTSEAAIYVTREQAMAFFGKQVPPPNPAQLRTLARTTCTRSHPHELMDEGCQQLTTLTRERRNQ